MSFLEDLAAQLNAAGVGIYPGVANTTEVTRTIWIGEMPDKVGNIPVPDLVVCLYARQGKPKELTTDMQYPELHVEVRATTYAAAQTKAEAVDAALHGQHDIDFSGHRYIQIRALGVPAKLEVDGRGRTIFYQNFQCVKGA